MTYKGPSEIMQFDNTVGKWLKEPDITACGFEQQGLQKRIASE